MSTAKIAYLPRESMLIYVSDTINVHSSESNDTRALGDGEEYLKDRVSKKSAEGR